MGESSDWGTIEVLLKGYGLPALASGFGGMLAANISGAPNAFSGRLFMASSLAGLLFPVIFTSELKYFSSFQYKNKNPGYKDDLIFAYAGSALTGGVLSAYASFLTGDSSATALAVGIGAGAGAMAYEYVVEIKG